MRLRRRAASPWLPVLTFVIAAGGVAGSFVWRTAAVDGHDRARDDRALVDTVVSAAHLAPAVDALEVAAEAERAGVAPVGTADVAFESLVDEMAVLPGRTNACVAPALATPATSTDPVERYEVLVEAGWNAMDLCSADLSTRPELQRVVDALPAFHDAGTVWTAVFQARLAAGVEPAASADAVDTELVADVHAGLPDGLEELSDVFLRDRSEAVAAVLGPIDASAATSPYQRELDWLRGPDGWRGDAAHPTFEELESARAALVADVEKNVLRELDEPLLDARKEVASARTEVRNATIAGVLALVVALVSVAWSIVALFRRRRRRRAQVGLDDLTGIPNRAGLRTLTSGWFDAGHTTAVTVVDLDHFKQLNDEFGHAAGDRAIVTTAMRLRALAGADTAVCRWGGDEFVVVSRLQGHADAEARRLASYEVAERIQGAVSQPIDVDGTLVSINATVGGSVCECGECALDDLFHGADRRLIDAKRHGRGRYVVDGCTTPAPAPERRRTAATSH